MAAPHIRGSLGPNTNGDHSHEPREPYGAKEKNRKQGKIAVGVRVHSSVGMGSPSVSAEHDTRPEHAAAAKKKHSRTKYKSESESRKGKKAEKRRNKKTKSRQSMAIEPSSIGTESDEELEHSSAEKTRHKSKERKAKIEAERSNDTDPHSGTSGIVEEHETGVTTRKKLKKRKRSKIETDVAMTAESPYLDVNGRDSPEPQIAIEKKRKEKKQLRGMDTEDSMPPNANANQNEVNRTVIHTKGRRREDEPRVVPNATFPTPPLSTRDDSVAPRVNDGNLTAVQHQRMKERKYKELKRQQSEGSSGYIQRPIPILDGSGNASDDVVKMAKHSEDEEIIDQKFLATDTGAFLCLRAGHEDSLEENEKQDRKRRKRCKRERKTRTTQGRIDVVTEKIEAEDADIAEDIPSQTNDKVGTSNEAGIESAAFVEDSSEFTRYNLEAESEVEATLTTESAQRLQTKTSEEDEGDVPLQHQATSLYGSHQKGPSMVRDSDCDSDVEDTIVTEGAKKAITSPPRTYGVPHRTHLQAWLPDDDGHSEDETVEDSTSDIVQLKPQPQRQIGFPAVTDLPSWFPKNIKRIYQVDRHGGSLSFKVSIISHILFELILTSQTGTARNHPLPLCPRADPPSQMEDLHQSRRSTLETATNSSPPPCSTDDQSVLRIPEEAVSDVEGGGVEGLEEA